MSGATGTLTGYSGLEARPARNAIRDFVRDKPLGALGAALVILLILTAVFAEVLAPYDPIEVTPDIVQPPSATYWMGTDNLGRDILSRVIWGARISVTVSFISVFLGKFIGAALGIMSAYYGGKVDFVIQRAMDVLLSLPVLLLALTIVAVFGPSLTNVIGAIALVMVPSGARVIRSQALSVMRNPYVDAARACGASDLRIMARHVLPNCLAPLIIVITISMGTAILAESSLSFLGVGVPPPTPTWGGMLSGNARTYMTTALWIGLFPGLAISLVILAFNLLGDALRDVLDPRLRAG